MRRSAPPPTLARCCASFGIETRRPRTSVSTGSTFTRPRRPSVIPSRSQSLVHSTQSARSGGSLSVIAWRGVSWELRIRNGVTRFALSTPDRPRAVSARPMKKTNKPSDSGDDLRPEYDFSGGVRGKYAQRFREGTNIVVLDPDVAAAFKDSPAVNDALRTLLKTRAKR